MGRAKEILVKVIPAKVANEFVKKHHYSGKVVNYSQVHFGCFLDDKLHGVLSYGGSVNKRALLPLVENSEWNDFIELNRMAFDDYLPKNSESRCIAISIKLLKKNAPQLKWIVSFADGVQCGDGTIYRASGFYLTNINSNVETYMLPNGDIIQGFGIRTGGYVSWLKPYITKNKFDELRSGGTKSKIILDYIGAKKVNGNMFRYIYLIDKSCKITVPILPFSKIDEMGAGMYKGEKISLSERQALNESDVIDSNFTS